MKSTIVMLTAFIALSYANVLSRDILTLQAGRRRRNTASQTNQRMFVSACPTTLEVKYVTSATHHLTKQKVRLTNEPGRTGKKFSMGSCLYDTPITNSGGICDITMQRHRTHIRCTDEEAQRNHYQHCTRVRGSSVYVDCLEWVELPGLCQLKIPIE